MVWFSLFATPPPVGTRNATLIGHSCSKLERLLVDYIRAVSRRHATDAPHPCTKWPASSISTGSEQALMTEHSSGIACVRETA